MLQSGAKGRQTCAPSALSATSAPVIAAGVTVTRPRTRPILGGAPISSISTIRRPSCQRIDEGPISRQSALWRSALAPRSVMVNRPPGP